MNLSSFHRTAVFAAAACWLALSGCGSDAAPTGSNAWFESDDPGRGTGRGAGGTAATGGTTSAGGSQGTPADDAERAIEEADIVKLEGDRLYALSRYGGLSVIDVSDPEQLSLLGRHRAPAEPFELYVRGGVALVLYNGYGEYVRNESDDTVNWTTSGSVIAYDARDPAELGEIGRFEVPGNITDSRIVGDILYVVGFENGRCWECASGERTTIVSLDVNDPGAVELIDGLSFDDDLERGYSWQRSISVTDERLYVAGPAWGSDGPLGSMIQVVDISDPGGALTLGASVQVSGQVASRWPMDEYEGVLRVVSQKAGFRPDLPPRVETFAVASSDALEPLGVTDLSIPPGEDLRSVRFDGPRAYAITALQTDPLITIDLGDPEAPRQAGDLEIPGWVYHMEPRGERVLGLGYDQGNPDGALAISLFDVSDLSHPALLDRVNFGGDWAWLSEDQDRIRKAFNVLDDEGLILMPFSGSSGGKLDGSECGRGYQSGVELIDWADDELTLRSAAPAYGEARRGFVHGGRLLAMSDERVESFDISDRDAPEKTSSLPLSHYVTATVPSENNVVRVAQNWWTNTTELDVTRVEDVESPAALARLEIAGMDAEVCTRSSSFGGVLASGDRAYVLYHRYTYGAERASHDLRVYTVDVADPAAPRVLGDAEVEIGNGASSGYIAGAVSSGSGAVAVGSALVVLGGESRYDGSGKFVGLQPRVHVLDLSDPTEPGLTTLMVDDAAGTTGLTASGRIVALGRSLPSPNDPARVRFFVDRIDVSAPARPVRLPSLNVPGSLLAFDAAAERAFSVDYRLVREEGVTPEECYGKRANASFEPYDGIFPSQNGVPGVCESIRESLRLLDIAGSEARVLGTLELEPDESIGTFALGDDRLFAMLGKGYYAGRGIADGGVGVGGQGGAVCVGCGWAPVARIDVPILVASGLASGELAHGRVTLEGGDAWAYAPLAAAGDRAVVSVGWRGKLSVIDGADPAAPGLLREVDLVGSAQQLSIAGDVGIAALGYDGVQTVPLSR